MTPGQEVLAGLIRRHYDFGEVGVPQLLPEAHQRRHRKLVIDTDAGRFLIKTYKREPEVLDALLFQHHLSDHLLMHGLPVAQIQRTHEGRTIVEQDTWAFEVQEFVEGQSMKINSDTLKISARTLARFHQVCYGLPGPRRDTRMWRFSEIRRAPLMGLFERAKSEGKEEIAVDYGNRIALFLDKAAKELSLENRDRFEVGLIHGDWHGGNLLFRKNRLRAIIDLEFAGEGCYLEDIAYAVSNLCIRTATNPERLQMRTDLMIDEYEKYRALSFHEQVALYYAVAIKHVTTVSFQIVHLGLRPGNYSSFEWMHRLCRQCAWLEEQADRIRWRK